VNAETVPVWINVRTTALPRLPFVADVLVGAKVDGDNKVIDPFSKGFFLRSVVLSPDLGTILNPAPRTVAASLGMALRDGSQDYATVDAPDYLSMLLRAVKRFRGEI
jgi:hypothetical protein